MRYSQKRVHPGKIIAGLREVFKTVSLKKRQRNFFLMVAAVCVSRTFRINEMASRLVLKQRSRNKNGCCVSLRRRFRWKV